MADVKGLLSDPDFQKLSPANQKAALGRVDSQFSGLSDAAFSQFKQKMVGFTPPAGVSETHKPDLPDVTNQDLARLGRYLPAAGATVAAIAAPEIAGLGWLGETALGSAFAAGGGGLGSAIEQGIEKRAGLPEAPKTIGEFGKRVGEEALLQGAYEAGGRAIAAPFSFVAKKLRPEALYQSGLKPSTSLVPGERDRVLQTGLREGIPLSRKGYDKLISSITDLTKQIDAKIAAKSPDLGAVISPQVVAKRLDALEEFYKGQAAPEEDINAIQNVREQFLSKHSIEAPFTKVEPGPRLEPGEAAPKLVEAGKGSTRVYQDMTLAQAQVEKRGTQRFNEKKYGERGTARDEAEKALAASLREQISALFPEVQALNKRDSDMLALEEQLSRFVGREGNKNVLGLIPAVASVGMETLGVETGHLPAATVLAISLMALDNPEVKSKLAIAIAKGTRQFPRTAAAGARLGRELPAVGIRVGAALGQ